MKGSRQPRPRRRRTSPAAASRAWTTASSARRSFPICQHTQPTPSPPRASSSAASSPTPTTGCPPAAARLPRAPPRASSSAPAAGISSTSSTTPRTRGSPSPAYVGACNGLVLLAAPWSNRSHAATVLLNPVSREEETITVLLDTSLSGHGGGGRVFHCFCGLGYSPSTKAYKALLFCTRVDSFGGGFCLGDLMVRSAANPGD
ncbi:hypothetical protein HU200_029261 [Digitaria exilis]|uniref:Uncharacterized protein n=1 Tax=Digitaria exilis TaxID=1010633 RepID=A0A835C4P4_9POAL|nr:hypothetical protein HU200_029261 [Digitaria exilis]